MIKMTEIKLKHPSERTRALCSVLAKKDMMLIVILNDNQQHGLFSDEGRQIDLNQVAKEVGQHDGSVSGENK